MATYERVTYGSPDGAMVGNASSEPVAFFGATPSTRPTAANQAAVTTTQVAVVSQAASSAGFSYSTALIATDIILQLNAAKTDINAVNVLVTEIRTALVNLGLIHGA